MCPRAYLPEISMRVNLGCSKGRTLSLDTSMKQRQKANLKYQRLFHAAEMAVDREDPDGRGIQLQAWFDVEILETADSAY